MRVGMKERLTGSLFVAGLVFLAGCQPVTSTISTPFGNFTTATLIMGPADGITGLSQPAYIDFGPDGKLYVTTYTGSLFAIALNPDNSVADVQEFQPIPGRILTGFAFDPDAPVSDPVLYLVSNAQPLFEADDFTGRVSRVTGAGFDQVTDVIDGLPRSYENHMTFPLLFGTDGRLYIGQSGNTNHGAAGPGLFGDRPESELSAAILVADVTDPAFGGIGDVEVYAPGLRNPYGMCLHSNGHIYIEDQGGNEGLGGPPGPGGVGMVGTGEDTPDELNVLMPDVYYGHPNPARGELAYQADLADG
ncbi:MAG: PQQ-dependent sugar dehydrogenase, partial [Phycisphaerales bacterium]